MCTGAALSFISLLSHAATHPLTQPSIERAQQVAEIFEEYCAAVRALRRDSIFGTRRSLFTRYMMATKRTNLLLLHHVRFCDMHTFKINLDKCPGGVRRIWHSICVVRCTMQTRC